MLTAPADPDVLAAPGLSAARRSIVPVKEFAVDAVFAASLTASSALAGVWAEDPPAPALELEPAAQPVTAAATIATSPAAHHGQRALLTCIKTSEA
jgi:hypothetical protein